MRQMIAGILACTYVVFAPVCFASDAAPISDTRNTAASLHVHGAEHHMGAIPYDTFAAVAGHTEMYHTVTTALSMLFALLVVLVALIAAVRCIVAVLYCFATTAKHARSLHRASHIYIPLFHNLLRWMARHTRSPSSTPRYA